MKLHLDNEAFAHGIDLASERLGIGELYIEKDYWITIALKRLAESNFRNDVVFKGGTSLSKCYGIIDRFSEDVDLAIDNPRGRGSSAIKALLKRVETAVAMDLIPGADNSGKKGLKRTTIHRYRQTLQLDNISSIGTIKLEVTAFSQTYPKVIMPVTSYIGAALMDIGEWDVISEYNLQPFELQVLGLERTFAEKVMALVKHSCGTDSQTHLTAKVRHIYDLQQIMSKDLQIKEFLYSQQFFNFLDMVVEDDLTNRTSDLSWISSQFGDASVFCHAEQTWRNIAADGYARLRGALFAPMPTNEEIIEAMSVIGERLKAYDEFRACRPTACAATPRSRGPKM